jgi:hypothetical protein
MRRAVIASFRHPQRCDGLRDGARVATAAAAEVRSHPDQEADHGGASDQLGAVPVQALDS